MQAVRIPARGTSKFAPTVLIQMRRARLPLDSSPGKTKAAQRSIVRNISQMIIEKCSI